MSKKNDDPPNFPADTDRPRKKGDPCPECGGTKVIRYTERPYDFIKRQSGKPKIKKKRCPACR